MKVDAQSASSGDMPKAYRVEAFRKDRGRRSCEPYVRNMYADTVALEEAARYQIMKLDR